jgi:endonuclease/exonuclease/phosphatase (EEP) superfamily protein YafD
MDIPRFPPVSLTSISKLGGRMNKIFRRTDFDLVFYGLTAAAILTCFARVHFLAELSTHFMLQYTIASTLVCVVLCLLRAKRWKIILSALLALYFGLHVVGLMIPRHVTKSEVFEDIAILQFNVNYANPNAKEIAGWINNYTTINKNIDALTAQTQPDIVVLQEVSPEIAAKLTALEQAYPYKLIAPKSGAFGVAIFSRIPIREQNRQHFPDSWNEYTEIRLHSLVHGIPIALTEVHTVPPVSKLNAAQRNTELTYIAQVVNGVSANSKILIGDMNITPYSPMFRDLQKDSKLTTVMQGKAISGTWPSFFPALLRLPIDHMLISENIEVIERRVEKDWDSDHLPVLTTLRIYKSE